MIQITYEMIAWYLAGIYLFGMTSGYLVIAEANSTQPMVKKFWFVVLIAPLIAVLSPIVVHFLFWKSHTETWRKIEKKSTLSHLRK